MTLKFNAGLTIATALGAVCTVPTLAQSVATQSSAPLQEVVVTASLEQEIPQQLATYGTHIDIVTAEQIQTGGIL